MTRWLRGAGLSLVVLLAGASPSVAEPPVWVPSVPLAVQGWIYLDLFPDGGGYVLRNNGNGVYFLKTSDGGATWLPATLPANFIGAGYGGTDFASTQLGYASSCGNCFFRTTDGAQSWEELPAPSEGGVQMEIDEVRAVVGTDTVILGGRLRDSEDPPPGRASVAISTDRGQTFEIVELGYIGWPYRMVFLDEQHGVVLGDPVGNGFIASMVTVIEPDPDAIHGHLLRARQIYNSQDRAIPSVGMQSPNRVFIGDNSSRLLRSDDGGATFTTVDFTGTIPTPSGLEGAYWIEAIEFADAQVGYLSTAGHGVFRTDDGGLTWTREVSPQEVLGIATGGLAVADREHALAGGRTTINRRVP